MKTSEKGITLIKRFEGCYLKAYQDRVGVWTIGYGTTTADKSITGCAIKKGMSITQKTADEWLKASLAKKYEPKVSKYDHIYHWTQSQFDALVSFAYNIGNIDQLTANGQRTIKQIENAICLYNHAGGKVVKGLTDRRKAEWALFVSGTQKDTKIPFKTRRRTVTNSSGANLRRLPSGSSAVASVVSKGTDLPVVTDFTAVNVIGTKTEYFCVYHNGEYLWAAAKLFE